MKCLKNSPLHRAELRLGLRASKNDLIHRPQMKIECHPEKRISTRLLAKRTGNAAYAEWYDALWRYAWEFFVDHHYGAWYRILDADNRKYSDEKSPAGKVDYHTMGACYEVLNVLR